jgi:hypothetical protein
MRERRGSYNRFCCRLYPFICWIIIKEGPGNFSSGRSPHWVNHVNLCLYCIVYLLCFFSAFVLFYCSRSCFSNKYLCRYCDPGEKRRKGKFVIRGVRYLPLRTIIFTIACMVGSAYPHMDLHNYFQYVVECMEPRVFNWSNKVLRGMKTPLIKCKTGDLKKFRYGSILVSLFLERVHHLCLQLDLGIPAPALFDWLKPQILMVDDYAYVGLDFRGDPNLVLPEGF